MAASKRYQGTHEPLISLDLYEKVQEVLDGRNKPRRRANDKNFLFTGLIRCDHCGCALVGDVKKQKYIYYRCSHFKGPCPEPYVREERLLEQFTDLIARVSLTPKMFEWLGQALKENLPAVEAERARRIEALRRDQDDIRERMKQAYIDNVDGKIDDDLFTRLTAEYRNDERQILRKLDRLMDADHAYIDEGIALISMARNARRTFAEAGLERKQSLLATLLSNSTYRDGVVTAIFRKPFDIVVESLPREALLKAGTGAKIAKIAEWLPGPDSNQRPSD